MPYLLDSNDPDSFPADARYILEGERRVLVCGGPASPLGGLLPGLGHYASPRREIVLDTLLCDTCDAPLAECGCGVELEVAA